MLEDLNEDQLKLAELMSKISEESYSAGWMEGLEFSLWEALNGGNRDYGRHKITPSEIEELRFLSEKCGCWIIFDEDRDETPIEIKEWERKFGEDKNKSTFRLIDEILWEDWDPIGVNEMDEVRDEYRSYVSKLVDLKIAGAKYEAIANHLFQIEIDYMGVNGNIENCRRVAQKIVNLTF